MRILALETSAKAAGCALSCDNKLLAESFLNVGLTHSETIMPMVESMLKTAGSALGEIDVFAVAAGPGSFTGLRIGIAAVKGMAMALQKPCAAVPTLEALAQNAAFYSGLIVPAMDARRNQVYTAIFEGGDILCRKTEDMAIPVEELAEKLKAFSSSPILLVGDGAALCYPILKDNLPGLVLAPENIRHQRASSVCAAASKMAGEDRLVSAEALAPAYLRLPQAERERLEKGL